MLNISTSFQIRNERLKEHTPKDQYCADHGVVIVENMYNLGSVAEKEGLVMRTFPINYAELTGLPCRIVAEIRMEDNYGIVG